MSSHSSMSNLRNQRRRLKIYLKWLWRKLRLKWSCFAYKLRLKSLKLRLRQKLSSKKLLALVSKRWSKIKLRLLKKLKNLHQSSTLLKKHQKDSMLKTFYPMKRISNHSETLSSLDRNKVVSYLISLKKSFQCKFRWKCPEDSSMFYQQTSSLGLSKVFKFQMWLNKSWRITKSM